MGSDLYTVSARILHGTSGGVVLNRENKVIGIVKAGLVDFNDDEGYQGKCGFVPIHLALEHLESSKSNH